MRARLKVSRAGVELIKSFEGLRQTATRLPDGRWTLGYGHTFSAREGARVTQEDADALLRFDLLPIVDAINNLVLTPLSQNQFDALVSFCFNIGVENFTTSTVLKRINEGRLSEAAQAMDAWRSAEFNGQTYVLAPLIRRRAAEKNLFLTPEDMDHAAAMTLRPVEDVSMEALATQPAASVRQVIDLNTYVSTAQPVTSVENPPGGMSPTTIREDVPAKNDSQAALQRARDEQARQDEARRAEVLRQETLHQETLHQAALRQAQAEARAAEQARLDREAEESARIARQQQEAAQAAEAARLEAAAKLERERLEQITLERARLEAARLEAARLEAVETARLAAEKAEADRLEREKLEAEQSVRDAEPAQAQTEEAANAPIDDAAENARKAEAAAALMRLYSPYGGGTLGRPLTSPRPVAPLASEGFIQHSVISPASTATAPIDISSTPDGIPDVTPPAQPVETAGLVRELQDRPVQVFASVTSASIMSAAAFSPYARPQVEPEVREAPRPANVDMPAQTELDWRQNLDRPLPQDHRPAELTSVFAPGEQARFQEHGFSVVDESYGDDAGWTLDGGRIAMSSDTDEPEHASWWTMIVSTFWWIFISGLGLGCLGVAAGAYYKSRDAVVIRNGAVPDYMTWSVVMAAIGILCVSVSLWLIMKRLGGLKD